MPFATADDGVRLHWEESGSGKPLLFIHEFAGDHRSFAPQVEHFRDRYRCLVYDARGYPPSDVPEDVGAYSQLRAVADAVTVLDAAGVERAHVVGVSMGGFCALHVGLRHPDRVDGLVIAGVGYGAQPDAAETFRAECEAVAAAFDAEGAAEVAKRYAVGPARVQFQNKNPRGLGAVRAPAGRARLRRIGADHARRAGACDRRSTTCATSSPRWRSRS